MLTGITLKPKPKSAHNQFILRVEGDSNDADYIYETTTIHESEIHEFLPIIDLLSNQISDTDYEVEDLGLTEDQADMLSELIPWGENGTHSICIDSFEYIDSNGITFDVSYDLTTIRQAHPELFI